MQDDSRTSEDHRSEAITAGARPHRAREAAAGGGRHLRAGGLLLCLIVGLSACQLLSGSSGRTVIEADLTRTNAGWTPAFSDFTPGREGDLELVSGRRALEGRVDSSTVRADSALYLAGTNLSDDLFMYLKRRVDGLAANARYRVDYRIEIATAAPSGCAGIGGPPGEAVWMKGGAASVEPVQQSSDGYLNVDKGNQSTGGGAAVVLGDVGNELSECTGPGIFTRKTLRTGTDRSLTARSSDGGDLWLFVGTESGFEGRTGLYYLGVRAELERVDD